MLLLYIRNAMTVLLLTACTGKTDRGSSARLDYEIGLEKMTRGEESGFIWTHARSAVIPRDPPVVITTMSKTLKSGSDVYHGLYEVVTRDLGETWTAPKAIPSLNVRQVDQGYRSMADMWPRWHAASARVLNIGTSPFYPGNKTHDGSKKEVTYTVYDAETENWSSAKKLVLPERDENGNLLLGPAAGSAQWLELSNGDILLPVFYFNITDEQASRINRDMVSVGNMMSSNALGFATVVVRCSFDGETLTYKELGETITLRQGRGVYEPSIAFLNGSYFLTMRSDKTAYVARSTDGLHFSPMKEWTFDDGSVLGSYNTQQHWVTHSDALFLVYTRRGANNDHVFRHRAPLFMGRVDVEKLAVIKSTERIVVPSRGAALGNFGIADISEDETWVTVAEYMRGEKDVEADNSVFVARLKWNKKNESSVRTQ